MQAMNNYPEEYIESCREELSAKISHFRAHAAEHPHARALSEDFGRLLLLALENYFVNRARGKEGRDQNALGELRLLVRAITEYGGILEPDPAMSYDPAKSILGIKPGEHICINVSQFEVLMNAFLDEIRRKYGESL